MAKFRIVVLSAKVLIDGKHKLRVSISHNGDTRYIPTQYTIDSEKNLNEGQVVGMGNAGYINNQLRKLLIQYQEMYDSLDNPDMYTCAQLIKVLKTKNNTRHKTLNEIYDEYSVRLDMEDKAKTKATYKAAKEHYIKFAKSDDILIEIIQPMDIARFSAYLYKKGLSDATVKLYMSLIKILIDFAKRMKYVTYEVDPFEFYKMPTYEPRDLAIPIDNIKSLIAFNGDVTDLCIIRDIWLLSFYLGGINLIDMLKINYNKTDIIKFERSKSMNRKKDYKYTLFDMQPEARNIIEKYRKKNGKLTFGRYDSRSKIFDLFKKKKDLLAGMCGITKRFVYLSARKSFFQIGFETGENPDVLDYCSGHAVSKRMAMNYIVIRPEMASSCMRRIFNCVSVKGVTENEKTPL